MTDDRDSGGMRTSCSVGGAEHLKMRFGSGYRLDLTVGGALGHSLHAAGSAGQAAGDIDPVLAWVRESVCPAAVRTSATLRGSGTSGTSGGGEYAAQGAAAVGATHSFALPHTSVEVSRVFAAMEAARSPHAPLRVRDWGLSQSSLEDVFVRIAQDAEQNGDCNLQCHLIC